MLVILFPDCIVNHTIITLNICTNLVVQRPAHVRAVYGRHKGQVLPVLPFQVLVIQVAGSAIPGHNNGKSNADLVIIE